MNDDPAASEVPVEISNVQHYQLNSFLRAEQTRPEAEHLQA